MMTAKTAAPRLNAHAMARTDTFDQVAKVGRDRGNAPPIPEMAAIATRAGRRNASTIECIAIS